MTKCTFLKQLMLLNLMVFFGVFQTQAQSCNYCSPTSSSEENCMISSLGVQVADFYLSQNGTNLIANTDYVCHDEVESFYYENVTLNPGETYDYATETSGVEGYHYLIVIDYNRDGDFEDSGETIYAGPSINNYGHAGSFSIPTSATPGFVTMRVRVALSAISDACSDIAFSETEDFLFNIGSTVSTVSSYNIKAEGECLGSQYALHLFIQGSESTTNFYLLNNSNFRFNFEAAALDSPILTSGTGNLSGSLANIVSFNYTGFDVVNGRNWLEVATITFNVVDEDELICFNWHDSQDYPPTFIGLAAQGQTVGEGGYFVNADQCGSGNMRLSDVKENRSSIGSKIENTIKVYPNPVVDELYIDNKTDLIQEIKISDVQGKEVYRRHNLGLNTTVNFSSFLSGMYLVNVQYKNGEREVIKITKI